MEIKGTGFTLRNWRLSDAPALQRLADNPKIAANLYNRFPSPYTMEDAEFFIGININEQPPKTFVIDIDGEFAGTIGLTFRDDVFTRSPLFGYWLGEPYWGRGIMSEAAGLVTQYAFQTFDIICLQAGVFSYNPTSMRVLEKTGFIKQGILKGAVFKNGHVLDEHIYMAYPPASTQQDI
ncbi:GNAT family N-acetyltransferase [Mucilaginibacter sp. ZT4R22]|uniref:GNAT family N-acetyltransferase n=1 Tax=Mucilaginibacter pankratovii TaxID=2772110 RepID=A0ABR7WMV6_9SPHI|nr:GNAT family protein [Mucilaginibacter pankratovii]MBD1363625.1 GNAT family N-acetyltransferase [Mucilaginibacter pankratovii]